MGRRIILADVALEKSQDFDEVESKIEQALSQVGTIPVDKQSHIEKSEETKNNVTFQIPIETDVGATTEDVENKFSESEIIVDYDVQGELEDGFIF
jgi:hypothetical protein